MGESVFVDKAEEMKRFLKVGKFKLNSLIV